MKDITKKRIVKWFWIILLIPITCFILLVLAVWAFADIPSFEELENPESKLATQVIAEDGEILKTNTNVASAGSRGWFEANSITSDERYVYVSLKYNWQDVIAVLVYDWNGNYIGEQVSYVDFNIDGNYNIQSVFMHGDELYFTLWVDGSGSIHLWKLYMMN